MSAHWVLRLTRRILDLRYAKDRDEESRLVILSSDVKKQHTVPRFLLSHFGSEGQGQKKCFTFDKKSRRCFQQSVKDATTRKKFYNVDGHPDKASLEGMLELVEGAVAPTIQSILDFQSLQGLTSDARYNLAYFTLIQRARSYNELLSVSGVMNTVLARMEWSCSEDKSLGDIEASHDQLHKNLFLDAIFEQDELVPHLLDKAWILFETDRSAPFWISDNPVTLANNDPAPDGYSNLGLAVKGVEVYLPLSSTLTLGFLCSKKAEPIREVLKLSGDREEGKLPENLEPLLRWARALESGQALKVGGAQVAYLNRLQVMFSDRYLFCAKDDFSLAHSLLERSRSYETGVKAGVF